MGLDYCFVGWLSGLFALGPDGRDADTVRYVAEQDDAAATIYGERNSMKVGLDWYSLGVDDRAITLAGHRANLREVPLFQAGGL